MKLGSTKLTVDTFVTDTRFFGDALFVEQYNEIGFSIGPQKADWKDDFRQSNQKFGIGVKYLHANDDAHAFQLTFGYQLKGLGIGKQ